MRRVLDLTFDAEEGATDARWQLALGHLGRCDRRDRWAAVSVVIDQPGRGYMCDSTRTRSVGGATWDDASQRPAATRKPTSPCRSLMCSSAHVLYS